MRASRYVVGYTAGLCIVSCPVSSHSFFFFFFNDTATTEIYTLSLHDALPISKQPRRILEQRGPNANSLCVECPVRFVMGNLSLAQYAESITCGSAYVQYQFIEAPSGRRLCASR